MGVKPVEMRPVPDELQKNNGGRPRKLFKDEKMQREFMVAIETGAPYLHACRFVGIHYHTFINYRRAGQDARSKRANRGRLGAIEKRFLDFLDSLEAAEAKAVVSRTAQLLTACKKDWRAAAWFLERRCPEEFGQRLKLEHTGADGGPVATTVLDPEQASAMRTAYRNHVLRSSGLIPPGAIEAAPAVEEAGTPAA